MRDRSAGTGRDHLLVCAVTVALLSLAMVSVAACGGSTTSNDPFVGTWGDDKRPDISVVIAKHGEEYMVVIYRDGKQDLSIVCSRHGRRMVGTQYPTVTPQGDPVQSAPVIELSDSGHLYYSYLGKNVDLVRTSTESP